MFLGNVIKNQCSGVGCNSSNSCVLFPDFHPHIPQTLIGSSALLVFYWVAGLTFLSSACFQNTAVTEYFVYPQYLYQVYLVD